MLNINAVAEFDQSEIYTMDELTPIMYMANSPPHRYYCWCSSEECNLRWYK